MQERAARYVLGLMKPDEMRQFEERLREGDEEVLAALRWLASGLADSGVPRASLRARLMQRAAWLVERAPAKDKPP